ncbi:MAG: transcription antitermination factor NusB [Coriobacteriia bacterium]|nr:transcription antitermination factor NusB [Coriobacteriia bacterium]
MRLTETRREALYLLGQARTRDAWGTDLLSDALAGDRYDIQDSAFITRLVYGVISAEGTLDEALDRYIARPSRVHPHVRDALRLAAYEILFMSTPPHVAVHQGVEAVRIVHPRATGLANAVLRRLAEAASTFPWGDVTTDIGARSRATAHPGWLVEMLLNELGLAESRAMLDTDNEVAPLYLAHNPFMGSFQHLLDALEADGAEPAPEEPAGCVRVRVAAAAVKGEALRTGLCVVADAAAQFCAAQAAPGPGATAVELAAGRGTKTLLMQAASSALGGPGTVISGDLHEFKVAVLLKRMHELGVPGVTGVVADACDEASISALGGPFSADVVMVDAPCSGLGTLRRHPEKRWRVQPHDIESLAQVSEAMLQTAARLVCAGGFMVYSTCTVTERENQQVIEGFLGTARGARFKTAPLRFAPPMDWERFVTPEGWFGSLPVSGGPDGHFVAVLQAE